MKRVALVFACVSAAYGFYIYHSTKPSSISVLDRTKTMVSAFVISAEPNTATHLLKIPTDLAELNSPQNLSTLPQVEKNTDAVSTEIFKSIFVENTTKMAYILVEHTLDAFDFTEDAMAEKYSGVAYNWKVYQQNTLQAWSLISDSDANGTTSELGQPHLYAIGPKQYGIIYLADFENHGELSVATTILGRVDNTLQPVFTDDSVHNNRGSSANSETYVDRSTILEFWQGAESDFYDIHLVLTEKYPESKEKKPSVKTQTFTFDGKKYVAK